MQLYPGEKVKSHTEPPPLGVYEGLKEEIYHTWDALNNSRIGWMERSAAYCVMRENTEEVLSTQQKAVRAFGSGVHCAVLRPNEFQSEFHVQPEGNRNSNAYKGERDWLLEQGYTLLNQDKLDACLWVRDKLFDTPSKARDILMAATRTEVAYRGEMDGYPTKALIDFQIPDSDNGTNGEIKTAEDISDEGFSRQLSNLRYYRQRVWYQWVPESVEPGQWPHHRIIAVQNSAPWETRVLEIQPASIMVGWSECRNLAERYIECRRTKSWPGYADEVTPIDIPAWRFSRL